MKTVSGLFILVWLVVFLYCVIHGAVVGAILSVFGVGLNTYFYKKSGVPSEN